MTSLARDIATTCLHALGQPPRIVERIDFTGSGGLPSAFAVTDFAAASIATAAASLAALIRQRRGGDAPAVTVDRRLASLWFQGSIRPIGWKLSAPWDALAGDYACRDGWVRLHTNAPAHRAAVERVLGAHADKNAMGRTVVRWNKAELESAVVAAGGCAAEMRSAAEWAAHPQGSAVAREPLVHLQFEDDAGPPPQWSVPRERPLRGIRVLDLTRVLAGPVASRFLAGWGAEVLRIDPPWWDEPGVVPEVNPGKRSARLDLRASGDRATFDALLANADVLLHGLRPGALDALGLDAHARRRLAPGLIDVSLDAYGFSGPWARRRGFDSLVQMSCGIAEAGMRWKQADRPVPLPVQALDHATGYLMAAAALRGIERRLDDGRALSARLSLARSAALLLEQRGAVADDAPDAAGAEDLDPHLEHTSWGDAQRLAAPVQIAGHTLRWELPARRLGSDAAAWADRGR